MLPIITIARQYGSGGHEVGERLAEKLNVPLLDKQLIAMAAKKSGLSEEVFEKADEKAGNSLLYSMVMGNYTFGSRITGINDMPINDKLFILQSDIIKSAADKGPCVIIGRCGDYILREQDLTRPIRHEDETCTTTWRIDQHYPMEKNSQQYPGAEWLSEGVLTPIDFYALPYRCFYSKDVRNMFMAGRNISVTHIALGSTRVMRTCGMIGEVVGMAASVCMKRNALPRDIYTTYFADLQELMRKGTGRTDVPYTQFYHQVDRTGHQAEDR